MKHIRNYELFESLGGGKIIVAKIYFYCQEMGETKMIGVSKGGNLEKSFNELLIALTHWIGCDEEMPGESWGYKVPENSTPEKLEELLHDWADATGWYSYTREDVDIQVGIFDAPIPNKKEIDAINFARKIDYRPKIESASEYVEVFDNHTETEEHMEEVVDKLDYTSGSKKILDFILS